MPERAQPFVQGEFYHLYNRGNSKQTIFYDDADRQRFLRLLYLANSTLSFKIRDLEDEQNKFEIDRHETLVAIGAYCLMPNHFHILLLERRMNGISKFMQKLTTGYSMYFNRKYERAGSLFEGKFKSQHVGSDTYLRYLFSYIHLNPVKLIDSTWKEYGIKDIDAALRFLASYRFSSYQDFVASFHTDQAGIKRDEANILSASPFPDYFDTKESLDAHILDWLQFSPKNFTQV